MFRKSLYIITALLLVITTTASIWGHLIADDEDPIEISSENEIDNEKSEKETEKEFDYTYDFLTLQIQIPELFCGFQKVGSSSYAPSKAASKKLYLLYHHLKLHC